MNKVEAINSLLGVKDKIKFFKDLENDEIKVLLKNVNFKKYISNEIIFSQGEDKDDYIYYLVSGYVNINVKSKDDKLIKVATLNHSSLIGEMKPILNEGRTATCSAGNNGAVVIGFVIDQNNIDKNSKAYAKFYRNMSFILAKKIQETNKRVG